MFELFKDFMKSNYTVMDHKKYANWYHKTFERPRRKKHK